eukprot:7466397-Alexandrium_andersonii.AAC.1
MAPAPQVYGTGMELGRYGACDSSLWFRHGAWQAWRLRLVGDVLTGAVRSLWEEARKVPLPPSSGRRAP